MAYYLHLLLLLCGISGLLTGTGAFVIKRANECPPEWTRLESRCFLFVNERLRFTFAETFCNLLGGNLASIHSSLENEVVRHVIAAKAGSFERSWTGLHDRVEEGAFIWTDGTEFDFDNWANNRPRTTGNQDCAEILSQGRWNDRNCNSRIPFVCAIELDPY
ncbi:ladderlectin-like [Corythoichthys intestinalis]|uniref:ladderlectin-like n=1 Tax=Corythoichthys intestinalis TaxID=161448 RepID=UPI0025A5C612|nr:ladderlectin-like [Corythoichthys intestinalis]